ncbi:MAG TPA: 6,7-dimethyl-8-ribityllumazine synthase [Myxococcota bacterium]|nr:6,7-dimethyl-8-ribityllumazine synthase [Myxococcota bacterium]
MANARYALIVSDFNEEITRELLRGAEGELKKKGVLDTHLAIYHVPGAIELPLAAQWCAKAQQFDAIICLGAVIRGETDHYHYVCEQVSYGCQKVMLTYNVPVIFGVLTVNTEEEALARLGGSHGHKGKEAAKAAIQMVMLSEQF